MIYSVFFKKALCTVKAFLMIWSPESLHISKVGLLKVLCTKILKTRKDRPALTKNVDSQNEPTSPPAIATKWAAASGRANVLPATIYKPIPEQSRGERL